jgi:arylsulfatase A-like enzyme
VCPRAGVFYTGQYSGVTGLTQTNGFGKPWDDPGMTWLHENEVPTIGNWLLAAGFMKENVAYFGKFHLADVDLRDDFGNLKQTLSLKNQPNQENINLYREKNLLKAFGFSNGWVGPEPHGAALENSGEYRDPIYVEEIKAFLRVQADLRAKGNNEPFAAFVNLVNPHDIVLAWALKLAGKLNVDPNAPIPPVCEETDYLDLSKEPSVVPEYKKTYNKMYCWDWVMKRLYDGKENIDKLRQFYYTLIKKSDESLVLIFDILKELNLDSETVVIFSSDHGDL